MPKKNIYALAGVILLIGIALAAVIIVGPRPEESAQTEREPAANPAVTERQDKTKSGAPPLLMILILVVVIATAARVVQLAIRNKFLKPIGESYAEPLRQIALEINSWTRYNDPERLEQLNREARKIGEELYQKGGWTRMTQAFIQAGAPKEIESA